MTKYPAINKLTKTEFSNYQDYETYPSADYTCSHCNETISIDFKSFNKHSKSTFSNFSQHDQKLFKNFELLNTLPDSNSFLDFYCPGCKRPVRIYFDSWAGGRQAEAGISVKYLVE